MIIDIRNLGLIENIKNKSLANYGNKFNIFATEISIFSIIPVKNIKIMA